ncbi:MAG: glycosyltransferase 87 family protein [Candidatus Nanopelagicales bacterium]|nr:glycosyltransferase 87 family protein [Candidatus Nanopelagicales bacterium]
MPLILGWALTRVWVLLSGFGVIFYPGSEFLFSDVRLYDWWAGNIADLHFPINDPMWQYPPLAAVVFLAGYLIAGNTVGFVFLATTADLAIFALLTQRGRQQANSKPATIWVIAPIVMGPIILGRFDVFVTLAAVVALLYVGQARRFGIAIAVGALLKVWPLLLLLATPKGSAVRVIAWFTATFVLGSLLLSLWWDDSFSFIGGQRSRGLQIESVGALPYQIWNAGPSTVTSAFQFGAIEVVASGTQVVSLVITLIGLSLLGVLFYWKVSGRLHDANPADVALLAILVSIVTSRVLSPQYMVWIFGLLAVCAFSPQVNFRKIATLIFMSAGIGQIIYPWWYVNLQQGGVLAVGAHTIRILTLIWATALVWKNIQVISQKNPGQKVTHPIS